MAVTLSPCRNSTSFRASDRRSSESWSSASIGISRHQPLKRATGVRRSDHVPISPRWVGFPGRAPNAGSIGRPRDAFVHEGERISPLHVSGVELFDAKSRRGDEIIDLAVEMTTAAEAFPTWCQAMLPPCYCAVGRQSVLHEQQAAIRTKHAPHFAKRRDD